VVVNDAESGPQDDPIVAAMMRRLHAAGMVTVPQLVEDTGADARTVRKRLNAMVTDGTLLVEGKTRGRRYVLAVASKS